MILIPDTISAQQLEKIQASFTNHEGPEGGNPGGPEGAHPQGGQHPQGATHPRNRWRCMQPRVCEYCWKTFSNSFNLKQHIVNVHIQSQGVACTMCEKVLKNHSPPHPHPKFPGGEEQVVSEEAPGHSPWSSSQKSERLSGRTEDHRGQREGGSEASSSPEE